MNNVKIVFNLSIVCILNSLEKELSFDGKKYIVNWKRITSDCVFI